MKHSTKLVSFFAAFVLLIGIGIFAAKYIVNKQGTATGGAQTVLTGANTTSAKPVPAPFDDEIVTIDEDSVITKEYRPTEREAIPVGPGTDPAAIQAQTTSAAKILYQAGTVFLQEEKNMALARQTLEALHQTAVTIGNTGSEPGSEELSAAFFAFLGTTDDPAYSDCGITLSNAQGIVYTLSAYSRLHDVTSEYSFVAEPLKDVLLKTERTDVTTYGAQENVTVSTSVITEQGPDQTTTRTYTATEKQAK